jgi:ferredoxin
VSLSIDASRCQGHGRCSLVSPKIFDITDDGLGQVLVPEPGPGDAADVARAIDNCPESAISFLPGSSSGGPTDANYLRS